MQLFLKLKANTTMLNQYIKGLLFPLIIITASCGSDESKEQPAETPAAAKETMNAVIPVKLVNTYPHSTTAYTEGLQYVDGVMYESTGHYGQSFLYKYEPETGKLIKELKIDDRFFGEGITVLGDKIYMLTYKEKTGLIFDKNTLKETGTFSYATEEGWGMTNDGTHLIYGDGTAYLYYLDPTTFAQVKRIEVTDNYGLVSKLNELEYINGYIYANQWETELIVKIDPKTGKVVGQADLRSVRMQAGVPPRSFREDEPEVLNGIAYDKATNRIFVTGKNWPKLLEVKLDN